MNILIFLIILLVLVVTHEWGHFIVAKKNGIRVDEFAFGMGPKLFSFRRGETLYKFNAFPIGGYVKIFGENLDEESMNGPDSKRSFVNKPAYIQAAVLFAGVAMNLILGWILVAGLYFGGTHIIFDDTLPAKYMENTHIIIAGVSKGMPAETANIQAGDIISKISYADKSKTLESYKVKDFINFVHNSNGNILQFDLVREEIPISVNVTPVNTSGKYMIGVTPAIGGYVKLSFFDSVIQGFHSSVMLVKETVKGLAQLVTQKASLDDVSGPVGMVSIVGQAVKMGFDYIIFFTALISLNLAVINMIPFPALDGGRLLFLLIEKIKGSRIKPAIANTANVIGFGLLMILMVVITYNDIVKLL